MCILFLLYENFNFFANCNYTYLKDRTRFP